MRGVASDGRLEPNAEAAEADGAGDGAGGWIQRRSQSAGNSGRGWDGGLGVYGAGDEEEAGSAAAGAGAGEDRPAAGAGGGGVGGGASAEAEAEVGAGVVVASAAVWR
jgi:hypothetical protein